MSNIGIIKKLDSLMRVVIPKDFRKRYGITVAIEIIATSEGILIRAAKLEAEKISTPSAHKDGQA